MFLAQKLSVTGTLSGAVCLPVGKAAAAGMQITELMRGASAEGGPQTSPLKLQASRKPSLLSAAFLLPDLASFQKG